MIILLRCQVVVLARLGSDGKLVLVCDLQFSHLLLLHQIDRFQFVILLLILGDRSEKRRISLLFGHELLDNLPDVRDVGLHANQLETVFNVAVVRHLLAHSLLEEGRPGAVDKELCTLLKLVLVLGVVRGKLSNFGLAFGARQPLLKRILLVLD